MTARANISVNDGEATPVAHLFVPDGDISEGLARFVNRNVAAPAASEIATISVRRSAASMVDVQTPGKTVSPNVAEIKIKYPATYTDSTTGIVLIDYIDESIQSFKRHPRSSEQRGKNLRVMAQNMLNIAQVYNAVDKTEPVW